MNLLKIQTVASVLSLFLLWGLYVPPACAQGVDVYLAYSGKNRKERKQLEDALPGALSVKAYWTLAKIAQLKEIKG